MRTSNFNIKKTKNPHLDLKKYIYIKKTLIYRENDLQ